MNPLTMMEDPPIRARIPADLDTPDTLVAGLSARQLGVLAAVAVPGYGLWMSLNARVPLVVLGAVLAVLAALGLVVALGRRDGLSLDRWLLAALRHTRRPHHLIGTPGSQRPSWAPPDPGPRPRVGVLRLPAEAIEADGVISTGPGTATVVVAASTVTSGLHTPGEQAVLLGGYARWLNGLSGPVQVVVSGRRVDLGPRALRLAENAHLLPHPALARAALEHAEHVLDLSEDSERLTRTVTIACTATGTPPFLRGDRGTAGRRPAVSGAGAEARRRGERTAAALGLISGRCRVLDGAEVTALLVAATDPYGPSDASWARTPPTVAVTAAGPEHSPAGPSSGEGPWAAATAEGTGGERDGVDGRGESGWCS